MNPTWQRLGRGVKFPQAQSALATCGAPVVLRRSAGLGVKATRSGDARWGPGRGGLAWLGFGIAQRCVRLQLAAPETPAAAAAAHPPPPPATPPATLRPALPLPPPQPPPLGLLSPLLLPRCRRVSGAGGHGPHGPRPLSHPVLERGFWDCALPMSSALLASVSEFRRLLEEGEGSTLDWDIYSLEAFSLLSHPVWDCRAGVWDSPLRCRLLVSHLLSGKYRIGTCAASSI